MWHANPNLAEIYDADVSFNVQSKSESCTKERNIKHLKCSNSRLVIFCVGSVCRQLPANIQNIELIPAAVIICDAGVELAVSERQCLGDYWRSEPLGCS